MKKLIIAAGLITALALAAFGTTGGLPVSFAGSWTLDKEKSQGLNQRMQNAEKVTCVIAQDDNTISVEWKIEGGQSPAGGPGGGGGMGAGRGPGGPQTYNLDGKEVSAEAMGGTNTMKATWSDATKTLELSSVRAGNFNGQDFKATTTDKMSLSADGKVLTINRHSESPRGTQDSTLVFNKQ
ncbi:MAG TPA: hypothetical protein VFZ40_13925 [Pyrinomonadaceae bacterium]